MSAFKDLSVIRRILGDNEKTIDTNKHKMHRGQYQIHLLIEATSGLIQQDKDVSCDVLIIVKAFGQSEHSKVKKNVGIQQTYWGEHMFFSKTFQKTDEIQRESIVIEIWDRNRFTFDALVGSYQIDVQRVYSENNHAFHHTWFALSNIERKFNEISGYLKLSVSVLGDSDKAVELQCEPLSSITAEKKVLMPPHIQRKGYQFTIQVHRGANIKPADGQTVDTYVGVQFGRIYQKTEIKRSTRDPEWNQVLHIPLSLPTVLDNINIRIIDFNIISKPQVLGSHYVNINKLIKAIINPEKKNKNKLERELELDFSRISQYQSYSRLKWLNFYGPQINSKNQDKKKIYQLYPDLAPSYTGSLLVKINIAEDSTPVLQKKALETKAILEKLIHYRINALITAGLNLQNHGKQYKVSVKCGDFQMKTHPTICNNGFCVWAVESYMVASFHLNQDVPDIFVYLVDQNETKICFARFKPKMGQILQDKWIELQPDLSIVKMKNQQAGYLKIALRMQGTDKKQKTFVSKKVKTEISKIAEKKSRKNGRIIIQLISAQNLLPLDQQGTSDPFFVFNYMNSQASSSVKNATINPIYFQKIIMNAQILDEQNCPPLIVTCYDQDRFSRQFMGTCFLDIGDGISSKAVTLIDSLKDIPPVEPKWLELKQNGIVVGKFLAFFSFLKNNSEDIPKTINIPKKRFKINLMIYGLRGMKSSGMFSVKKPYIEFDYESLNVYYSRTYKKDKEENEFGYYNKNVITQPNQSGASVNIQMVNQTIFYLPADPSYWPSLTAVVRDNIIGGLVEPTLGYFSINLRQTFQQTKKIKEQFRETKSSNNSHNVFKKNRNRLHEKYGKSSKIDQLHPKLLIALRTFILKTVNYNWSIVTPSTKLNSLKGENRFCKLDPRAIVLFPEYSKQQQGDQGKYVETHREYMKNKEEYMAIGYDPKQIQSNATFDKRRKHYRFMMDEPYQEYYQRVNKAKIGLCTEIDIRKGRTYYGQDAQTTVLRKLTDEDTFVGTYKGNCYIVEDRQQEQMKTQEDQGLDSKNWLGKLRMDKWIDKWKNDSQKQEQQRLAKLRQEQDVVLQQKLDDYSMEIMKMFMTKTKIKVFLYVIEAASLPAKDAFSLSDPYLVIKCGDLKIDLQEYVIEDTSNPQFNRRIEFDAEFPGDSILEIQVWDQDPMKTDELIGSATIDLQNRVLANAITTVPNNPIETHQLKISTSNRSQGLIRFWLDLIPIDQISMYRPFDISAKENTEFEVRVIVYGVFGMPINDAEGMTDLFCAVTFKDQTQETDVHYRSATGDGSFNWRCVFKVKLPVLDPTLSFRVFDKDLLSNDDYLASTSFSIGTYLDQAFQSDTGQKLYLGKNDLSEFSDYTSQSCKKTNGQKMYDIFELDLFSGRDHKKQGTIQVSIEILTEAQAKKKPAGVGRQNPNQHPHLSQPKGRLSFTWNPITMLTRLLGRGFRYQITCAIVILIVILLIWNFGQAFGGAIIANLLTQAGSEILGVSTKTDSNYLKRQQESGG